MLTRNSHSSKAQGSVQGRKINNNVNIVVATGSHNHSHQQKRSLDIEDQIDILDTKRFPKPVLFRNKENMDNNVPLKKTMVKTQSTKSIPRAKKIQNALTKSTLIHKKGDSARSSLEKRAKSQVNLAGRKVTFNARKSLSPKTSRQITMKPNKPLLSQRDPRAKGRTSERQKKKEGSINSLLKQKKTKKKGPETHLVLNDQSIDLARELDNMTRNYIKAANPSKKQLKPEKKVIISENVSKHRPQQSSRDSPEMTLMTQRYKGSKKNPSQQPKSKVKDLALSQTNKPHQEQKKPHMQSLYHKAASTIQLAFRKYMNQKYLDFQIKAVVRIQRWWRYKLKVVHSWQMPRIPGESSLVTIKDFEFQSEAKRSTKCLKIEILEESKEFKVKDRIKYLLDEDSNVDSNKYSLGKRISFSPLVERQEEVNLPLRHGSPTNNDQSWNVMENLPSIQKIHKEKLVRNFNSQKQAVIKLWQEKLCSPRTQQGKLRQLDQRLNKELARFQAGVKQVLRGWNLSKYDIEFDEPQSRELQLNISLTLDAKVHQSRNDIREISDISVQLSAVKQTSHYREKQFSHLKFDSSLQGIETYLTFLYEFLMAQPEWKEIFVSSLALKRGISIRSLLSNLDYTEQQDPNAFKVPLYKHFVDQNIPVVPDGKIESFNLEFPKLRSSGSHRQIGQLEYFHIQAVVDALNEQFHQIRPQNSLLLPLVVKPIMVQVQQKQIQTNFSLAYDGIHKSASFLCGFIDDNNELEEEYLVKIKQTRLRQMLSSEIKTELQASTLDMQLIETKVSLGQEIFLDVFEEAIQEMRRLMGV